MYTGDENCNHYNGCWSRRLLLTRREDSTPSRVEREKNFRPDSHPNVEKKDFYHRPVETQRVEYYPDIVSGWSDITLVDIPLCLFYESSLFTPQGLKRSLPFSIKR